MISNPDTILALYQAGEAADAAELVSESELPPPTTSLSFAGYVDGVLQNITLQGTVNEVSVTPSGLTVTVAFDGAYFLKGYNTAADIRTRIGLGAMALAAKVAASADAAAPVGAAYVQAEVQAILDELRDLKAKMRTALALAT